MGMAGMHRTEGDRIVKEGSATNQNSQGASPGGPTGKSTLETMSKLLACTKAMRSRFRVLSGELKRSGFSGGQVILIIM